MFPREQRLRSSRNILTVLRRGERYTVGAVRCFFIPKAGKVGTVAVIVDTKVARHAVDRNLLKRRIRADLHRMGLPEGQLIVRLFPGALSLSHEQLIDQLRKCLHKISS